MKGEGEGLGSVVSVMAHGHACRLQVSPYAATMLDSRLTDSAQGLTGPARIGQSALATRRQGNPAVRTRPPR